MAPDPYEPCPCGSGKKLKFCCTAIVGEMDQVRRLNEGGQIQACFKKLDELNAAHPRNPWVLNYRGSLYLATERPEEAREDIRVVLEQYPDNQMSLILYANALFVLGGFEAARPSIHRAFQKCVREMPGFVADLALNVASEMMNRQNYMSARQHLTFAIRFANDSDREYVFKRLHEFDSSVEIPYPLRSVHLLAEATLDGDDAKEVDKARRLAEIGCWGPAAKVYAALCEKHPQSAALQQNLGLCRAWDGDQGGAATALHASARLDVDRFNAIECETVAQLLDRHTAEEREFVEAWTFEVGSIAKALGRFDQNSRFVKIPLTPEQRADQKLAAMFQVLDRQVDDLQLTPESDLDSVPNVVGHLAFYDNEGNDEEVPQAFYTGFGDPEFAVARDEIARVLGDELKSPPKKDADLNEDSVAREEKALFWRWHCPAGTSQAVRRQLEQRQWKRVLEDVWLVTPLHALGGKSPREAAGSPESEIPLIAALYVLDSFCNSSRYLMDFAAMCGAVGVEPPARIEVTDKTPITHFSAMKLKQINVKSLADEQLIYVSNRAMMLHHGAFLYETLEELLSRPACVERAGDLQEIFSALVDLSTERYRRDLAFGWIDRARAWASTQPKAFEVIAQWQLRELMLRLEDPTDEQIPGMFQKIQSEYGRKLPDVTRFLNMLAEAYGFAELLDPGILIAGTESSAGGSLWTPGGAEGAAAGEGKKLWLPGQD